MNRIAAVATLLLLAAAPAGARISQDPEIRAVYADAHWGVLFDFPPCYAWAPLQFLVEGTTVEIVQQVERSECPGTHPGTSQPMPRLPAGPHTFVYRQVTSTGVDVNPEFRVSFLVRGGDRSLSFFPSDPVALEPVDLTFENYDTCWEIRPPRFDDGGITIERQYVTTNYIACDAGTTKRITLGAFPPGEYPVTVVDRYLDRPTEVRHTAVLRVRSGPAVPPRPLGHPLSPATAGVHHTSRDVSGVWTLRERPGEGLQLVHAFAAGREFEHSRVSLVWYTYDEQRNPAWLFAALDFANERFEGALQSRSQDGVVRDLGTVSLRFPDATETPQGVLEVVRSGTTTRLSIERLRWTRGAWLPWETGTGVVDTN